MTSAGPGDRTDGITGLLTIMGQQLGSLPAGESALREFLATYLRTTEAIGAAVASGHFEDPVWVERWDVAFADLYLDALAAHLDPARTPPRPWRLALERSAGRPPLLNVLLGINAHINYDLPQALLAVISDDEFGDAQLLESRHRDHGRIDAILSGRVAAEDGELSSQSVRSLVDRALRPANRWASRRFLAEARAKVWLNTVQLQQARRAGADAFRARLAELELLTAAKVADLQAPGQVLLRLAVAGFGVTLPPPA